MEQLCEGYLRAENELVLTDYGLMLFGLLELNQVNDVVSERYGYELLDKLLIVIQKNQNYAIQYNALKILNILVKQPKFLTYIYDQHVRVMLELLQRDTKHEFQVILIFSSNLEPKTLKENNDEYCRYHDRL